MELAVVLDGATAARALAAALTVWLSQGLHARLLPGGALWRLPGGSVGAVRAGGRQVRVALAPDAALARRLVS